MTLTIIQFSEALLGDIWPYLLIGILLIISAERIILFLISLKDSLIQGFKDTLTHFSTNAKTSPDLKPEVQDDGQIKWHHHQ